MSYAADFYDDDRMLAAHASASARTAFIQRTYLHVAGAILAFAGIEYVLMTNDSLRMPMLQLFFGNQIGKFLLLGMFIGGGYIAQWWAFAATSRPVQYLGLGLYVVLQALIFLPLLTVVEMQLGVSAIQNAALMTLALFGGLTTAVFLSGKDYSFLGPVIAVVSWIALATILGGWLFGFNLGLWFSLAMIALAAAAIIYDTSNVLHRFRTDQHVGAALQLFASIALLFYYILLLFLQTQQRR